MITVLFNTWYLHGIGVCRKEFIRWSEETRPSTEVMQTVAVRLTEKISTHNCQIEEMLNA